MVRPIYKKGNHQEISNYRPISLLTSFSKVVERIMFNRLSSHLEINSILAKEQFGFRPNAYTEQAAYIMTSGILTAFSDKLMVGGIFCGLHKAFDCLNHEILIKKPKYYGIQGKFNALIESYLKGRFQK